MLLFKPNEGCLNAEHIRYQFTMYNRLLLRYLEHKYRNVRLAQRKFICLHGLLSRFAYHLERARKMLPSMVDMAQMPQIIVEVLDLN